ncbi:uncharacterized protein MONOS_6282 [Monocercomonoides exilis]|uniref:uncharacterized protein n=1 Tax=Monocercomonoides exilis TaxID=2049356 RepID=UPI00355A0B07|nr:hypothetical protein MONOS_6282 [Monocercomonoides exilis]|eukprot:MONOS_6282.1-p1 / transcript=MONOS_6282.1 / gene=MONOS_6282 / organism=Monocercomonoides_exilis_PA203 / gene_product=unspecified product / transcript_product=unspecified product / location=Mono_scaffold00195:81015-82208(-) / protein_length=346 / sequence_SO=supercontig / SO=protein_coding / is_pseudo=false
MASEHFDSDIVLDRDEDASTNSLLAIELFAPAPNPPDILLQSQSTHSNCSSGWVPSVEQHRALMQLLMSEERIVEKVKSYLFGSWSEESWKAIFGGSKFSDDNDNDERANMYSADGANFQQMADGLFCEEESKQEMMMDCCEIAVKAFGRWPSIPILQGILKFIERDLLSQIAFLLCEAASDTLGDEAAKALLNAWATLSRMPILFPIFKGFTDTISSDMDAFHSRCVEDRVQCWHKFLRKKTLWMFCGDIELFVQCTLMQKANADEVENEKENKENPHSDAGKDLGSPELTLYDGCCLKALAECLDASRMSPNEYAKVQHEEDDFFYFWREESHCCPESDCEAL